MRRLALPIALALAGCVSTEIVHAPVSTPDVTAYGTQQHVFNAGVMVQRTIATGIVGSTPTRAGRRGDSVWRLVEGGLELEYCESGVTPACQQVSTGDDDRDRSDGPLVILDPVNRGRIMQETTTTTPDGKSTTTTGSVAIGNIQTPFTHQRGAWLTTSQRDELLYCSAPDGRAACRPIPIGGPVIFGIRLSMQIMSVHVLQKGDERLDVVWLLYGFQSHRCEGREHAPVPTCKPAKIH
jgi:hypothetical protein